MWYFGVDYVDCECCVEVECVVCGFGFVVEVFLDFVVDVFGVVE